MGNDTMFFSRAHEPNESLFFTSKPNLDVFSLQRYSRRDISK